MTPPDHRHIPLPLDRITGITADPRSADCPRPRQACACIAAGAGRLMTGCVVLVPGNTLPVWRVASGLPCCLLVSQHWLR
jgi:hypothetical protein